MLLTSDKLVAFYQVAQCGRVHEAARRLRLTQTAVTIRIKKLEEELGKTLFLRSRKGMSLTEDGVLLLRYCRRLENISGEFQEIFDVSKEGVQRRVRVVGASSVMQARIIPAIKEVLPKFKSLSLTFSFQDLNAGMDHIKNGIADLAIVPRSKAELEFDSKLLEPEKYILVAPKSWKIRPLDEIIKTEPIVDFDEGDVMTHLFLEKIKKIHLPRPPRHYVNNTKALAQIISGGFGYSVLTKEFSKPLIGSGQVCDLMPGKVLDYDLALIWYPRKHMPQYMADIIKSIK